MLHRRVEPGVLVASALGGGPSLAAMAPSETPPVLVRLALRMHLPIQPRWRPWAMSEIERRYGPNPSTADRDIQIAPYIDSMHPWADAPTSTGGRIYRRPDAIRKADDQYAAGLHPDGTPAPRGSALVELTALFERLPERMWPWIPVMVIAGIVVIVVVTVVLALSLT